MLFYVVLLIYVIHNELLTLTGVVTAAQGGLAYWEYLLTTRAGVGWVSGSAYITGDLLTLVLVVMALCSLPIVRKSGKFEVSTRMTLLYNCLKG